MKSTKNVKMVWVLFFLLPTFCLGAEDTVKEKDWYYECYEIAELAFHAERVSLNISGGW